MSYGVAEDPSRSTEAPRRAKRSWDRGEVTQFLAGFAATVAVAALVVVTFRPTGSPAAAPAATASSSPAATVESTGPSSTPIASATAGTEPPTGEWTHAGTLVRAHGRAALLTFGTGSFLAVGDDNVCSPGAAWPSSVYADLGDASGVWNDTAALPKPRDRFAAVTMADGNVLVAGGTTEEAAVGPRSYSSAYVFEGAAWSRVGVMVKAHSDPAFAVLQDGRVLVAGGYYVDLPDHPPARVLASTELFDPASGTWSPTSDLHLARYGAQAVTLADGRVLVVGGWGDIDGGPSPLYGSPRPLASAELFDPRTGEWAPAGSLAVARHGAVLVALPDGGAIVAGGRTWWQDGEWSGMEPTASAERFDPSTRSWTAAAAMPTAAAFRAAIRLADGRILVAGGDLSAHRPDTVSTDIFTTDAAIFDPATGAWTAATPLPAPRADANALLLGDGSVLLATGFGTPPSPEDAPSCPIPDPAVWIYRER